MKQLLLLSVFACLFAAKSYADRIYIMNSPGYNSAGPEIIAAMQANGHTVTNNTTTLNALPAGFTSRCVDPVNGYDWLCFFGSDNFSPLSPQIKAFIDVGGKVFYQYEVTCCTGSSDGAAAVASSITGLPITPNPEGYIALNGMGGSGWEAADISCCATFNGNAYKGMDGIPAANQFQATSNVGGSSPSIAMCLNFGFYFATTDFTGAADKGGFVGVGDMNMWYDGQEPGSAVNTATMDFFFPDNSTTCYLFPPGCLQTYSGGGGSVTGTISSNAPICPGQQLELSVTSPTATTYSWTGPNSFTSNIQNPVIPNAQAVNEGTYTVTISDGSCSTTLSITVALSGSVNPVITAGGPYCANGAPVTLSASMAGGTWSGTGITNAATGTFDPSVAGVGTHTITYDITGGCSGSDTQDFVVNDVPVVTAEDVSTCPGKPVTLQANGATTYTWLPATGLSSNTGNPVTATVGSTTTYTVTGTQGGCSSNTTVTVNVTSGFVASAGASPNPVSAYEPTVTLTAGPAGSSFYWVLGDGTTSTDPTFQHTFNGSTTNQDVILIATSPEGCVDSVRFVIYVESEVIFYIPNSFTPDGDEFNQMFQPVFTAGYDPHNFELLVYNRWGELIFETHDATKGWDGTYHDKLVPDGMYTWTLTFKSPLNDQRYEYQGHVTKIR